MRGDYLRHACDTSRKDAPCTVSAAEVHYGLRVDVPVSEPNPLPRTTPSRTTPASPRGTLLQRWGRSSWLLLGILACTGVFLFLAYVLRGILVPLVIAMVVGVLFEPLVAWLARHRVPRWLGAAIVLVGLIAVMVGAFATIVIAIADQWEAIVDAIDQALDDLQAWLADLGWDITLGATGSSDGFGLTSGFFGNVLSGVSTAANVLFGILIGTIILYLTLADANIWNFAARAIPLPREYAEGIVEDSFDAVRGYFKGQTLIGLSNLFGTWFGLAVIGVPSAFAIGIVTFITSYIPYIGAFAAGAFAVIIALGAGGIHLALLALIVVLVVQNVLQNLFAPFVFSSTLQLNPLLVLISTIAGGIVAGVWGATLGTPALAAGVRAARRFREYDAEMDAAALGGQDAPVSRQSSDQTDPDDQTGPGDHADD